MKNRNHTPVSSEKLVSDRKGFVSFAVTGLVLLVASGGGTQYWSEGFAFLFAGSALLIFPPKTLPGRWVPICMASLLLWISISTWLPFPWSRADWWIGGQNLGMELGSALSAQPLLSSERAVFLIAAFGWLLVVLGIPLGHERRSFALELVAHALGLLALVAVIAVSMHLRHPWVSGPHQFSYFPNHNQHGMIMALGGMLSFGLLLKALERRHWKLLLFCFSWAMCCLAVFQGRSRSALVALIVGCMIIAAIRMDWRKWKIWMRGAIPVALMTVAAGLIYGDALIREWGELFGSRGIGRELRFRIILDAWGLCVDHFWFGVGLGNFRFVFPFYQSLTQDVPSVLHPESDILWLWAELGFVGVLIVVTGLVFLFKWLRVQLWVQRNGVRMIALVSVAVFATFSLIEVNGHRLGTAMLALMLLGLLPSSGGERILSRMLPWISRLVGFCLVVFSVLWVGASERGWVWKSEVCMNRSLMRPLEWMSGRSTSEIHMEADAMVRHLPLVWTTHNQHGIMSVHVLGDHAAGLSSFSRARYLNPRSSMVAFLHGTYWAGLDMDKMINSWIDAIRMSGDDTRPQLFHRIMNAAPKDELGSLRVISVLYPELSFDYLWRLSSVQGLYERELERVLASNPELIGFTPKQRESLLINWYLRSGVKVLKMLRQRMPYHLDASLRLQAYESAELGNLGLACSLGLQSLPRQEMISLSENRKYDHLRSQYLSDPSDPLKAIALIQKLIEEGRPEEALVMIQVAMDRGNESAYLKQQQVLMYAETGQYGACWDRLRNLLRESLEW